MLEDFIQSLITLFAISVLFKLLISLIVLIIIWLFIRSAVYSGTQKAIMKCYIDIMDIEEEVKTNENHFTTANNIFNNKTATTNQANTSINDIEY